MSNVETRLAVLETRMDTVESGHGEIKERLDRIEANLIGLHADNANIRGSLEGKMADLRGSLEGKITDIHKSIVVQTRWILTVFISAAALIPVLLKLLDKLFP